jgi:DNA-binding winged helix-turn-helix (wHTH) protein
LSAQNGAVLRLLMHAAGGFVSAAQIHQVSGASTAGTAVASLNRRLTHAGEIVPIQNTRSRGWRLVDPSTRVPLSFAGLNLDPTTGVVSVSGQEPITLSASQGAVLEVLMQARGELVSATQIRRASGANVAGVAVGNLNRRLHVTGIDAPIVNIRKRGWKLAGERQSFTCLSLDPRSGYSSSLIRAPSS